MQEVQGREILRIRLTRWAAEGIYIVASRQLVNLPPEGEHWDQASEQCSHLRETATNRRTKRSMISISKDKSFGWCLRYSGGCDVVAKYLFRAINVRSLRIERDWFKGKPIDWVSFLSSSLEKLRVRDWEINNIHHIEHLPKLKTLSLSTPNAKNIDLSALQNLEEFNSDFSLNNFDTRQLKYLKKLIYGSDSINNLECFSLNKHLEYIDLVAPSLSKWGDSGFPRLERVELANVHRLESLKGIEMSPNIKWLWIVDSHSLADLSSLQKLAGLEVIGLDNCPRIGSLSFLDECSSLREIYLHGTTSVKDGNMSWLNEHPSLEKSSFEDRKHYDIKARNVKTDYVSKEAQKYMRKYR